MAPTKQQEYIKKRNNAIKECYEISLKLAEYNNSNISFRFKHEEILENEVKYISEIITFLLGLSNQSEIQFLLDEYFCNEAKRDEINKVVNRK